MTKKHSHFQSLHLFSHSFRLPLRASVLTGILLLSSGISMTIAARANYSDRTLIAQIPASATRVIYVNPLNGVDNGESGSTANAPVRTITYALQQAQPGTVVQLAAGSYTEKTGEIFPLVVKQGVILRGDEAAKGQTIGIIGGGSYVSPTIAGQNVTIRAEKDTEISGVGITNPNTRGTGLWIESTNAVVRNNIFSDSKREGVFVSGTAEPKIENNLFTKNQGNGISVARNSKGEIRNNVFDNTGIAIVVTERAAPLIVENRIVQNVDGIVASNEATPILRKNVIEGNQQNGVVVTSNAKPDLGTRENPGENRIRNNRGFDLYNASRTNTIVAIGNDIDQKRISGRVEFIAASVPVNTPPDTIPTPGGSTRPPTGKFNDIQGHWAQAYIEALASKEIIAGFPDGNFRPADPVTRAQFAAIISKAFTPKPDPNKSIASFKDVSNKYWAYQAIQTVAQGGFLSGYPGPIFKPDERIARVQVLVALASGLKLRSDNTNVLSFYNDSTLIPDYARTAVAGATIQEFVFNYPTLNQLAPKREATRAEVAAFVYQALASSGRFNSIPSPYQVKRP